MRDSTEELKSSTVCSSQHSVVRNGTRSFSFQMNSWSGGLVLFGDEEGSKAPGLALVEDFS